jgi:hypothetical protein
MEVIKIKGRIISEEKETVLNYDYINKTWSMYSVVSTHYNKALKQGWTPTVRYEYEDGTVAGYCLEAPGHSVTIRSVEKKKMSEKQMQNLQSDDEE